MQTLTTAIQWSAITFAAFMVVTMVFAGNASLFA